MRYYNTIFDLDGTLLDTLDDLHAAVNHGLAEFGLPKASPEEIAARLGNGSERLISLCLPEGREDPLFEPVFNSYLAHYMAHGQDKTRPYPGVLELLRELGNAGVRSAIVSNKPHAATVELAEHYFSGLVLSAVGEQRGIRRKPAPDSIISAMSQLHAEPSRTVYIGDSEVDIMAAQNAGIDCISVTYGFRTRAELISSGGTIFADNAQEIAQIVLGA